ncbi:MAG: hypothetical protein M1840_001256 [Geoglossum simile]|nr:MAG: hypothetical protein M1840_001256 [Geoglossum simile]
MAAQIPIDDVLRVSLSQPPRSSELQCAIYNALWEKGHLTEGYRRRVEERLSPYFSHYESQCEDLPGEFTHWHVMKAVEFIRNENDTKAAVHQKIRSIPGCQLSDKSVDVLIHLAVRLWLMICAGKLASRVDIGQFQIPWAENECLKTITDEITSPQQRIATTIELPTTFKAVNLEHQAGMRFFWTSNLADHLLLRDDYGRPKVHIFHHASFLKQHLETGCIFLPDGFLRETLQTLALLFPQLDNQTRRWYDEKRTSIQAECQLDRAAIECGLLSAEERQIDNFLFWGERIIALKRVFDDTDPRSFLGLWRDTRKITQWYTFWIAVLILALTIIFGLVQSVTGIMQVWVSMKSLHQH